MTIYIIWILQPAPFLFRFSLTTLFSFTGSARITYPLYPINYLPSNSRETKFTISLLTCWSIYDLWKDLPQNLVKRQLKGQWIMDLHSSDREIYDSKWMLMLLHLCWMCKQATVWHRYMSLLGYQLLSLPTVEICKCLRVWSVWFHPNKPRQDDDDLLVWFILTKC